MTNSTRHLRSTAALAMLLSLAGITTGCRRSSADEASVAAQQPAASAQTEFGVEGMHCATCPVTVKAAAKGIAGVSAVRVDMAKAKAWVTYDPKRTTPTAIAAAITASGYKATPARR